MTPFTAGFCFALSSMSVTARFLAFLFASPCSRFARRAPSWRRPMSRLYTTADAFFLFLTFRATLSSRASGNSFKRRHCRRFFFSRSIDRSIELCVVSFNVAPHKMSASSVAFSDSENMHFRSTASTALLNSLLTLRSRRPFERVFFLSSNETSDRTVTLRWLDGM
jgi:hypothetical protein